jgi:hypothetical protein
MIVLTKGEEQVIYFTGTENCLLANPYFLFVFTNRTTNDEIKFIITNLSTTKRFDFFYLEVNEYFENYDEGFWTYDIYEQATNTGTSIAGKHKVETGLMYLHPADSYEPIKYDEQSEQFKAYNG